MAEYDLSENDMYDFEHRIGGYGLVAIHGDSKEEREQFMRDNMSDPLIVVDGEEIESDQDMFDSVLLDIGVTQEELDKYSTGSIYMERGLVENEANILFVNFDAMDKDLQSSIAQHFKSLAENRNFDGEIGFTATEGNPVVRAESDLRMRVYSWDVDEYKPEE